MSALATMEAFEKLLNESLDSSTPKEGEVVNGSVIAIEAGQAIIDIGYEAVIMRDYPVIFATLYFFSLLGLIMGIISDFMYSIIDPRIDFEAR